MAPLAHRLAALERRCRPFHPMNCHRVIVEPTWNADGTLAAPNPIAVMDRHTGQKIDRLNDEPAEQFLQRAESELAA